MNANNTRNVHQALFQSEILEEEQAKQAENDRLHREAEQAENDRLHREAEQAERARLASLNGDAVNNTDFASIFDTYQPSNDGEENMREKYLKYKIKYLNLKKLK